MIMQGGLPFLSNPATSTGVGPTTLQQGPPLLPPGAIQGSRCLACPLLAPADWNEALAKSDALQADITALNAMCPPPVVDICKLDEGVKVLAGPGANPAVANSAALSAVDTSNMPTITSVVFDGFLSDCTVCFSSHCWKSQSHGFVMHTCLSKDSVSAPL